MKRIARLLSVVFVLLGVMLAALPGRALAANQYPYASEVYVSGKPMSDPAGTNHATYDPSTGTLTITNQVIGVSVQSERGIPLDLNIVVDGHYVPIYGRSNNAWSVPNLYALVNDTGGDITIRVTAGSQLIVNSVIMDEAAPPSVSINAVAAIHCNGKVTLTGDEGSTINIYARSDWYVKEDSKTTLTSAVNLTTTGIFALKGLSIEGGVSGKVQVQNHGTAAAQSKCSSAVRVTSGAQVNISSTGDWSFDSNACGNKNYPDSYAALFYINAGTLMPTVAPTAGNVTFYPGSSSVNYFVLNGSGWSDTMSSLPDIGNHTLVVNTSQAKYRLDDREPIDTTTIRLSEIPALGTPGTITAENTVLDLGISNPRYTLKNAGWQYRLPGDEQWHVLGTNQYIPENATGVRASFSLEAKEGYRFCYSTDVIVRYYTSTATVIRHTSDRAYMRPGDDPSTGTFYVELRLDEGDLADQHPIESVEVYNVQPPYNGAKAWVETGTDTSTSRAGHLPSDWRTHYAWATSSQWGSRPGFQYWTEVSGDGTTIRTLAADEAFQPGRNYCWHCVLGAKTGWVFTDDTDVTVNKESANVGVAIGTDGKTMELTRIWVCPTLSIGKVEVIDQTEPVAGEQAVIDGTVPDDACYSVVEDDSHWVAGILNASTYWTDANTPFTGTFAANEWYTLVIFLEPDRENGYGFSCSDNADFIWDKDDATINGSGYDYGHYYADGTTDGRGRLMIFRTFYCTNPDAIERVDIDATLPVVGQVGNTAQSTHATTSTPDVTMQPVGPAIAWLSDFVDLSPVPSDATSAWMGQLFDEDENINVDAFNFMFAPGGTYQFTAVIHAESGRTFAVDSDGIASVKVFVGGVPARVSLNEDKTEATVTMFYYTPTSGEAQYQLFVPVGVSLERQTDDGGWILWEATGSDKDYNLTGFDRYPGYEGMRFRVKTYYPGRWKAPAGHEFYKWVSPSADLVFEEDVRKDRNTFVMPGHDVTIDILTQKEGTLPTVFNDWMIDGYAASDGWENPDSWSWTTYNGSVQWREAVLVDHRGTSETSDDIPLTEGVDYVVSYSPAKSTDAGEYTVTYTGIPGPGNVGGYEGSFITTYSIEKASLANCSITLDTAHADDPVNPGDDPTWWEYYTGEEIRPSVTVKLGGVTLAEGTDYVLTYYWNTDVGNAFVQVDANMSNNIAGWNNVYFEIRGHDLDDATITPPADVEFTGEYQYPPVTITFDGKTLVEDEDYYAYYSHNCDAGTATVRIEGNSYKGWSGTREVTFQITPMDFSNADIEWNDIYAREYTGEEIKPFTTSPYGGNHPTAGSLYEGTDFTVAYENNVYPGVATATLTGTGNYTGTHDLTFDIYAYLDDSYFVYSGVDTESTSAYSFQGTPVEPKPVVTLKNAAYGDRVLAEGVDYQLVYTNSDKSDVWAWMTVGPSDTGYYQGERIVSYYIAPTDLAACSIAPIGDQVYTGSELKPAVTITLGDYPLVKDRDYTVEYANNVEIGTATVTVTAIAGGNFTGTESTTFEIVEKPAESPFVDVDESTFHYEDILWMFYSGISQGWDLPTGREYRPMEGVARADMAAFLYRLAGEPYYEPTAEDRVRFNDVDETTAHHDAIWWLASTGISTGFLDGGFHPYDTIVRCDMAAFLFRLSVYQGRTSGDWTPSEDLATAFNDVTPSTYHYTEVLWLASTGVSSGFPDGGYHPMGTIVRCDMAAFMYRMYVKGLV